MILIVTFLFHEGKRNVTMRITNRKRLFPPLCHCRVTKHSQNVYTVLISTDLKRTQKLKTLTSLFSILTHQNPEITRKDGQH